MFANYAFSSFGRYFVGKKIPAFSFFGFFNTCKNLLEFEWFLYVAKDQAKLKNVLFVLLATQIELGHTLLNR